MVWPEGGSRAQRALERAFRVAMPTARRMGLSESASSASREAEAPRSLPEVGMARAELGQQTASGRAFTGVKQTRP